MIILAPTTVTAQIDHNALIFAPLLLLCSSLTWMWAIFFTPLNLLSCLYLLIFVSHFGCIQIQIYRLMKIETELKDWS